MRNTLLVTLALALALVASSPPAHAEVPTLDVGAALGAVVSPPVLGIAVSPSLEELVTPPLASAVTVGLGAPSSLAAIAPLAHSPVLAAATSTDSPFAHLGTILDGLHAVAWVISLLGLLVVGIPKGFTWLDAHTKIKQSALADAVKSRLLGIVERYVLAANQASVDQLKADYAAGKVTSAQYRAELARIKQAVIAKVIAQVKAEGIFGLIEEVLGVGKGGQSLEALIADLIESVLGHFKLNVPKSVVDTIASTAAGAVEKMVPLPAPAPAKA